MVAKWRGISAVLAITLALGIGVNTAIFSVLNGWLLRPLPVPTPEQITVVAFQPKETSDSKFSYPDLVDFEKQAGTFSSLFAFAVGGAGLSADGVASEFAYSAVTGNYFSALGVKPLLGRLLLPGEGEKPGEELLVVLGYAFWQKRFGGDAGLVGKRVLVEWKAGDGYWGHAKGVSRHLVCFRHGWLPFAQCSAANPGLERVLDRPPRPGIDGARTVEARHRPLRRRRVP